LLDGQSYNSSRLSQIICDQQCVGTSIGVFDEDEERKMEERPEELQSRDILGFSSILSLDYYKDESVIQEIMAFILDNSKQFNKQHEKLAECVSKKSLGLLMNERFAFKPQNDKPESQTHPSSAQPGARGHQMAGTGRCDDGSLFQLRLRSDSNLLCQSSLKTKQKTAKLPVEHSVS
jgi:hypothetical protein